MSDFREKLRDELISAQQTRASLVREKMVFVIGALGVGALSQGWREAPALLYLVPLIAISFDLYIAGENFGVRRAGAFLAAKSASASEDELAWESFAEANRDPFSRIANPLVSVLAVAGAAAVLWPSAGAERSFWIWLLACVVVIAALWVASHVRNRQIYRRLQGSRKGR